MRESGEMAGATDLPCVFISFRQFGHRVPERNRSTTALAVHAGDSGSCVDLMIFDPGLPESTL